MNKKILILAALAVILFAACGDGSYAPKPEAYLRIDLPEKNYAVFDTAPLPFQFDKAVDCKAVVKQNTKSMCWVDLEYPMQNGVVFLTYKKLASPESLRGQIDTSYRLLEQHFNFSSGVEEQQFENPENRVFATTYHIKGRNVASTYQFWATDSVKHFLCGALYINESPNNDSLAPVLDYLQQDVNHLIETLRWK